MIRDLITDLGAWSWMALGLVLLILEIVIPGVFLLWIGIAAIITGGLSLLLWDWASWTWHVQVLLFLVLSVIAALVGKRVAGSQKDDTSDQPLLNRRSEQLLGRTATLTEPIREGRGRIQLGDTLWRVSGPDLPIGARVQVVKVAPSDLELMVEAVPGP